MPPKTEIKTVVYAGLLMILLGGVGYSFLSFNQRSTAKLCDPSYPDVCIPPYPPDLDCSDIPERRFRVVGPDPHRFDGDKHGIGCER